MDTNQRFCPGCGAKNESDISFCPLCGTKMPQGEIFHPYGAALSSDPVQPSAETPAPLPAGQPFQPQGQQQYVPYQQPYSTQGQYGQPVSGQQQQYQQPYQQTFQQPYGPGNPQGPAYPGGQYRQPGAAPYPAKKKSGAGKVIAVLIIIALLAAGGWWAYNNLLSGLFNNGNNKTLASGSQDQGATSQQTGKSPSGVSALMGLWEGSMSYTKYIGLDEDTTLTQDDKDQMNKLLNQPFKLQMSISSQDGSNIAKLVVFDSDTSSNEIGNGPFDYSKGTFTYHIVTSDVDALFTGKVKGTNMTGTLKVIPADTSSGGPKSIEGTFTLDFKSKDIPQ